MRKKLEATLASYIDALHPIIYINYFDFNVTDKLLLSVGEKAKIIEFNNSLGAIDFYN